MWPLLLLLAVVALPVILDRRGRRARSQEQEMKAALYRHLDRVREADMDDTRPSERGRL